MSFAGSPNCAWKWDNGTAGAHSGNTLNNYRNEFTTKLFERLRFTQISSRDALTVIKQRDSDKTFYYLDPPYPGCCQQHYKGYDTNDLKNLLELLETIEGKFLLSNYMSPMLDRFIKANKWNYKIIELPMQVSNFKNCRGNRRKQEVLVYNYKIQPTLFD